MAWILLLTIMTGSQSSMTTVEFSDHKSCMKAGEEMKELLDESSKVFKRYVDYHCIAVNGLK